MNENSPGSLRASLHCVRSRSRTVPDLYVLKTERVSEYMDIGNAEYVGKVIREFYWRKNPRSFL